jgi:ADP-heptose:LPS heptosyltransferase
MFIGHDSGISHLAAAVGTPSLLLFGPTDPEIWAPVGEHVRILRASEGNLRTLEFQTVRDALEMWRKLFSLRSDPNASWKLAPL